MRVATLSAVQSTWDPLPVDAEVGGAFAHIMADLRAVVTQQPIGRWAWSTKSFAHETATRS